MARIERVICDECKVEIESPAQQTLPRTATFQGTYAAANIASSERNPSADLCPRCHSAELTKVVVGLAAELGLRLTAPGQRSGWSAGWRLGHATAAVAVLALPLVFW